MGDWKTIGAAMKSPAGSEKGPQHGSTTTGGASTTASDRNPAGIKIHSLKQAIWIRSLLRPESQAQTSKPAVTQIVINLGTYSNPESPKVMEENPEGSHKSKSQIWQDYPGQRIEIWMRRDTTGAATPKSTLTENERSLAQYHLRAAHEDTILAHLTRLSAHKPIKGTNAATPEEGSAQTAFLLDDFTSRLLDLDVTELQLYFAIDKFINDSSSEFFPTYAKLKKAL